MKKNKLLETFRTYYLQYFILSLILFGILYIVTIIKNRSNPNPHPEGFLLIAGMLLAIIVLTVALGGLSHLYIALYIPWRQRILLGKRAMIGFEKLGFKKDRKRICYQGYVNRYYIKLIPITTTSNGEWINASTILYLKKNQINDIEKLAEAYKVDFVDGFFVATTKIYLKFNKELDVKRIKSQLEDFVDEIKMNNIEPSIIDKDKMAGS